MIRIRTNVGNKRVFTLFHAGKWITLTTGKESKSADNLLQGGINHLEAAVSLLNQP